MLALRGEVTLRPFPAVLLLAGSAWLAGCTSFGGAGLVPGQATEAEVVAKMGRPAQVLRKPDGSQALYFSRLPEGRQIFMASIGPDGVLQKIEPTLDYAHINRIKSGVTTASQAREILGPPYSAYKAPFKNVDVWEYQWQLVEERRLLWLAVSPDGIVREVTDIHDHGYDEPTGADMPSS